MADKRKHRSNKGKAVETLSAENANLPRLSCTADHKVFFKCANQSPDVHCPYTNNYIDSWSDIHVRMPCSPQSLHMTSDNDRTSRWDVISSALRSSLNDTTQLQQAICSYNECFKKDFNFEILHRLSSRKLLPDGDSKFFQTTLPAMCSLALNLPKYITEPIPLLGNGYQLSLTFSQLQIASLIANMFFCTFTRWNERQWTANSESYPLVHFAHLFSLSQRSKSSSELIRKQEKLRCFLHYFSRITTTVPDGSVTFTRRKLGSLAPDWLTSTKSFSQFQLCVNTHGSIEDSGFNTMQVDFADPYVGGLVLSKGCVQEEILFLHRPEMLAACLFVSRLADDETLIIEGAERYSRSLGYSNTFRWIGDFQEADANSNRDSWGRWKITVVAMDATRFTRRREHQFTSQCMLRELNKAYCAFCDELAPHRKLPPVVSTGNWGCGIFRGDVHLKALLQMMACVQANKSMLYYTFGNVELHDELCEIHSFLSENNVTVGKLTHNNGWVRIS